MLDRILESKRLEVGRSKRRISQANLRLEKAWAEPRRGFLEALRSHKGRRIVAEIKKASPSRGVIRADFQPAVHARQYQEGGATCLSVLTDGPFFQGSLDDLRVVRASSTLPLLRKDFVVDPYQISEARAAGADAVLLIVAALDRSELGEVLAATAEEGLDALVEVHDRAELAVAVEVGARLIGINNRNLKTFETTTDVTRRLIGEVPAGTTVLSESGLGKAAELEELERLGVSGFLIGESFMAAPDPGRALAALLEAR